MAYLQYGKSILRRSSDVVVLHHPILYAAHGVRYRKLDVILTTVRKTFNHVFFKAKYFVTKFCMEFCF